MSTSEEPLHDAAAQYTKPHIGLPVGPSGNCSFGYFDHMGDIALHGFGDTLTDAFEQTAMALYAYMCPKYSQEVQPTETLTVEVQGRNLHMLLFNFLDELLFRFGSEAFIGRSARISVLETGGISHTAAAAVDPAAATVTSDDDDGSSAGPHHRYLVRCAVLGERWEEGRHSQGCEVKAITMHDMSIQLDDSDGNWHTKVVVDL